MRKRKKSSCALDANMGSSPFSPMRERPVQADGDAGSRMVVNGAQVLVTERERKRAAVFVLCPAVVQLRASVFANVLLERERTPRAPLSCAVQSSCVVQL